jgi:RNA-directed DNA polymerase
MNATARPAYEWNALPWRDIERRAFKLQTRIYRASQRGDNKAVRRLQRLMVTSWSGKCLATRRVTQDNQGKKTAGVDGVRALTPRQRLNLVNDLRLPTRSRPLRRVWIPKPHAPGEQRPLGIPTVHDRAAQALLKLALEPEWEVRFSADSYGFRPGRSAHDAIAAIYLFINKKHRYVLDADIRKCFDRIDHNALLSKLNTTPTFRRAVKAWLTAGVIDGGTLFPTTEGVPQGGVISPLLANIALHGLKEAITSAFPQRTRESANYRPKVVQYADDFVVLHEDVHVIEQAQQLASAWLKEIGLELHPDKTRLVHTLDAYQGQKPGVDFLGFNVRQYHVGKHRAGTMHSKNGMYKTIIKPSNAAQQTHHRALAAIIHAGKAVPQGVLIARLNRVIRGWSRYYAGVCSTRSFNRQDQQLFPVLWHWAVSRHRNKGRRWIKTRYWPGANRHWLFAEPHGKQRTLARHTNMPITRHVKVQDKRSPYDGDWLYWTARTGRSLVTTKLTATLLKRQRGKCAWCGLYFQVDDLLERDHILRASLGGPDHPTNRQLLHRHCHDAKSATDKGHPHEEPDDAKGSRPVLQTGGIGRPARLV